MPIELYDRLRRQEGWHLEAVAARRLVLVIAARGPFARALSLFAACIGIESQVILAPDIGAGLDIADATMRHAPNAFVDVRSPRSRVCIRLASRVVVLRDVGDEALDDASLPSGVQVSFAERPGSYRFGTDARRVRAHALPRPLVPRAEASILLGELLLAVCTIAGAYTPATGLPGLPPLPGIASIPLRRRPRPIRRDVRLYLGGLGGAIAHMLIHAGLGFDEVLRDAFRRPGSCLVGADGDIVEESNRSRQVGYRRTGDPKASATARWITTELLPGARVVPFDEVMRPEHRAHGPFDAAVSSLDSWGDSGRRQLARFCVEWGVPAFLSTGSSFFGGFSRLVTAQTACPFVHGREKLDARPEQHRSCADAPAPSSLIPQAIVGGLAAAALRDWLAGGAPDPRGHEVHLLRREVGGPFRGLAFGPGPLSAPCRCGRFAPVRGEGRAA